MPSENQNQTQSPLEAVSGRQRCRRFRREKEGDCGSQTQGQGVQKVNREPETKLPTGVWFDDSEWQVYRGTLPAVLDVENLHDPETPKVRVMHVSQCPACERKLYDISNGKRVVRWLILPP